MSELTEVYILTHLWRGVRSGDIRVFRTLEDAQKAVDRKWVEHEPGYWVTSGDDIRAYTIEWFIVEGTGDE